MISLVSPECDLQEFCRRMFGKDPMQVMDAASAEITYARQLHREHEGSNFPRGASRDPRLILGLTSLHTKCFEHSIGRVGIETGLKLCKEFSRNRGDIAHASHRKENASSTRIKGHLK